MKLGCCWIPNTVIELDTSMDSSQTRAILRTTVLVVVLCLVFSGFLIPRYRPKLMKHMCIIEAEQARTSHVTYTLHHTIPNGQFPETRHSFSTLYREDIKIMFSMRYEIQSFVLQIMCLELPIDFVLLSVCMEALNCYRYIKVALAELITLLAYP